MRPTLSSSPNFARASRSPRSVVNETKKGGPEGPLFCIPNDQFAVNDTAPLVAVEPLSVAVAVTEYVPFCCAL